MIILQMKTDMKILNNIVMDEIRPLDKDALWIDISSGKPIMKVCYNGQWKICNEQEEKKENIEE